MRGARVVFVDVRYRLLGLRASCLPGLPACTLSVALVASPPACACGSRRTAGLIQLQASVVIFSVELPSHHSRASHLQAQLK